MLFAHHLKKVARLSPTRGNQNCGIIETEKISLYNNYQKREQTATSHENMSTFNNLIKKSCIEKPNNIGNESSLYLIIRDKFYPAHLKLMKQCSFISTKQASDDNLFILNIQVDNQAQESVLKLEFKGLVYFPHGPEIQKIIKAPQNAQSIGIEIQIYRNIQNSLDFEGIFILYKIHTQLKVESSNSEGELQENYQLNFSKDEFLRLAKHILMKTLRAHENFNPTNIIVGLDNEEIFQIISTKQIPISQQQRNQLIEEPIENEKQILSGKTDLTKNVSNLNIENSEDFSSSNSSIDSPELYQNKMFCYANNEKLEEKKLDNDTKPNFFDIECVASPVIDLEELNQRMKSFGAWSENQDNRFMVIENESDGQIMERESEQDEDDYTSENEEQQSNPKQGKSQADFPVLPKINKHFVL